MEWFCLIYICPKYSYPTVLNFKNNIKLFLKFYPWINTVIRYN